MKFVDRGILFKLKPSIHPHYLLISYSLGMLWWRLERLGGEKKKNKIYIYIVGSE